MFIREIIARSRVTWQLLFTYYTSESEGETMIERWGDSQADRDAYDRWLTTEPDRGEEEAL